VYWGFSLVNLRERLAGIDVNLDDVQAAAEATSRAADSLVEDSDRFDDLLNGPLLRAVTRHVKELQACANDQRTALEELRSSLARLRQELELVQRATIRPPPLSMPQARRR
jgi:ABC-type transporter Mla subunit MlaD